MSSLDWTLILFTIEIVATTMVAFFTIDDKNLPRLITSKGKMTAVMLFGLFSVALLLSAWRINQLDLMFFTGLAFCYASIYISEIDVSCHQIPWGFTFNWIIQAAIYIYACGFFNFSFLIILGILIVLSLLLCLITMPMNFGFADCWSLAGILMLVVANGLLLPYFASLFVLCLVLFILGKQHPEDEKYQHIPFIPLYCALYPIASIIWNLVAIVIK